MSSGRLVTVLGYSGGAGHSLHDICAARLRLAEQEARPGDVILLSGGARRGRFESEAELMARSWRGPRGRILLDRRARSTRGNAVRTAAAARTLGVTEIVLVTSGWHGRRAAALFRTVLRGSSATVTLVVTNDRGSRGSRVRRAGLLGARSSRGTRLAEKRYRSRA